MSKHRWTIFVSHSHDDAAAAGEIVATLDALGLGPWLDKREIKPGDSFVEKMSDGLSEADYVLVLFSAASLRSHWVRREWLSSLARRAAVIPVRLEPVDLPAVMSDIVYIDLFPDRRAGLQQLAAFFARELETSTGKSGHRRLSATTPGQLAGKPLWERSRRELRLVSKNCMSESEFAAYLYDMDIDKGDVEGASFNQRLLWLLTYLKDGDMSDGFARWLSREKKACVTKSMAKLDAEAETPESSMTA